MDKPHIIPLHFWTTFEERPIKVDRFDPNVDLTLIDDQGYLLERAGSPRRKMEMVEEDWVRYSPAGFTNATETEERIRHLKPGKKELAAPEAEKSQMIIFRWKQIEPAYRQWKAGEEMPTVGTPLGQWPGIKPAYVAALKNVGITTVEGVRDMLESVVERVRLPNLRLLRTEAGAFLENTDRAAAASREADMQRRLDEQAEQMEAMRAMLEEMTAPAKDAEPGATVDDEIIPARRTATARRAAAA